MASHELRTPVSVVLGAVSVMEKRGKLDADDARTLLRIKRASRDMSANIDALLNLVRRIRQEVNEETFRLLDLLLVIREDYELDGRFDLSRLVLTDHSADAQVHADRILVKMVLHNIISNALSHTRGQVCVMVYPDHVEITDEGGAALQAAAGGIPGGEVKSGSVGLGLYIVNLACERLGWLFETDAASVGGRVRLWFSRSARQRAG
jgi:K+-sensing histidine kinase KdpD